MYFCSIRLQPLLLILHKFRQRFRIAIWFGNFESNCNTFANQRHPSTSIAQWELALVLGDPPQVPPTCWLRWPFQICVHASAPRWRPAPSFPRSGCWFASELSNYLVGIAYCYPHWMGSDLPSWLGIHPFCDRFPIFVRSPLPLLCILPNRLPTPSSSSLASSPHTYRSPILRAPMLWNTHIRESFRLQLPRG